MAELSSGEVYAGAALFSIALHARQGSYIVPDTEHVKHELLETDESKKVAGPGTAVEQLPPASTPSRSFAETVMKEVECVEAASSSEQLATAVFERLGVPQRAWRGLLQIPTVTSGLTVRAAVDMYLGPLKSNPEGSADDNELLAAKLRRIMESLIAAVFTEPPAVEGTDDTAPRGQKQQHDGAPDIPTLPKAVSAPIERWLDARAAQAIADLAGLFRGASGAKSGGLGCGWEAEFEALMAEAAVRSLVGSGSGEGLRSVKDSKGESSKKKWSTSRVLAVGGTTVVAGTLLAVTGGLAAPAIAAGLSSAAGVFGGAAAASAVSGVATTAAVTTTMGVTGAGYGGAAMLYRTAAVREFGFLLTEDLLMANQISVAVELRVTEPTTCLEDESGWWRPVQVSFDVTDPFAEAPAKKPESAFSKGLRSVFKRSSSSRGICSSGGGGGGGASPSGSAGDLTSSDMTGTEQQHGDGSNGSSSLSRSLSSNGNVDDVRTKWRKWGDSDMHLVPAASKAIRPDCTICVAGWIQSRSLGFVQPFESAMRRHRGYGEPEVYCLVWESKELRALHNAIMDLVGSYAGSQVAKYFMTNFISAGLVVAMAVPSSILLATKIIDNSWSIAQDRADKAGLLLAQRLVASAAEAPHHQRPVRLIGFSMGARLIFSCLLELARCGHRGVVEEVLLVGAPVSLTPMKWASARSAVAGRFVNGFCSDDWLLGMVFRTSRAFIKTAAGLQAVSSVCPEAGVEDVDLLARGLVKGHTDYPKQMSRILEDLGMGGDSRN